MKVFSLSARLKYQSVQLTHPKVILKQASLHITTRSERAKELMQDPHIVHIMHKKPLLPKIFFFFFFISTN